MVENPFQYSAPLAPEDLLDRDEEAARLVDRAHGGHNSRLVAPRRFGKTSLLKRALRDVERDGFVGVYVDFFGVLTVDDLAARIERAYSRQLRGPLAQWFDGVRRMLRPTLRAGAGPVSAEVALEPAGQASLLDRLALPVRLHQAKAVRTVVVFDEFQDILAAGERMDAVLRSEIQHHGPAASYIFAGSHRGMMTELFADKRRAFYAQASPFDLAPLRPDDVAEYVTARFGRTRRSPGAALGPLLDTALGHPQRTMLLAHHLWNRLEPGGTADEADWLATLDHVMGDEAAHELRALWSGLSSAQQRALTAVAEDAGPLFGREVQRRTGASRGGGLQSAITALDRLGEITEDPAARTGYRVTDPLLGLWVRAGRTWPPRD